VVGSIVLALGVWDGYSAWAVFTDLERGGKWRSDAPDGGSGTGHGLDVDVQDVSRSERGNCSRRHLLIVRTSVRADEIEA